MSLRISFIVLNLLFVFSNIALATPPTPPGEESTMHPLEEKVFTAKLYLVGIATDEAGQLVGTDFAWIPKEVQQACEGLSYKECRTYYHERFRTEIDADGRIGLRQPSFWRRLFPNYPPHVISDWILEIDDGKAVLEALAERPFIKAALQNANRRHTKLPINLKHTIKAKVHWTEWPNGYGFEILEVLE